MASHLLREDTDSDIGGSAPRPIFRPPGRTLGLDGSSGTSITDSGLLTSSSWSGFTWGGRAGTASLAGDSRSASTEYGQGAYMSATSARSLINSGSVSTAPLVNEHSILLGGGGGGGGGGSGRTRASKGSFSHSEEDINLKERRATRNLVFRKVLCALLAFTAALLIVFADDIFPGHGLFPGKAPARRALGLFAMIAMLWATEAIPVYATGLLVPIFVVIFRVLVVDPRDPVDPLSAQDAAEATMASLFSGTVLVALGAFTMSLALSKYGLTHRLATVVLKAMGTGPKRVLLAIMLLGLFLSMWINNIAAPVVVIAVVEPLLQALGTQHSYAKAILLGIAFSCNIGGMTTPISSPQNIIAMHVINNLRFDDSVDLPRINWGNFLAVSLPYSVTCCFAAFFFVWFYFRPTIIKVPQLPKRDFGTLRWTHAFVLVVCLATVTLWALGDLIAPVVGSPGIVGLLPVVSFFTLPILGRDDFKELQWDALMLLAGGLALGDALNNSGLLHILASDLAVVMQDQPVAVILLSFCSLIWFIGNFVSHTVAAIVLLPILATTACHIGDGCAEGHVRLLVVGAVFVDSGAMGLPVSSFPNVQTFALQDIRGKQFLVALDFVKTGFIFGIVALGLMMSLGYALMQLLGF